MTTPYNVDAKVTKVRNLNETLFLLRLRAPDVARSAKPGQFVMLGPVDPGSMDPFLSRPFSIFNVTSDGDLDLLIAEVGRGTKIVSSWSEGMIVGLIGPLGRGFEVPSETRSLLLVGGGVGLAPLVFLGDRQLDQVRDCTLLYGAASSRLIVDLGSLLDRACKVQISTDDGSMGHHGLVTELLLRRLQEGSPEGTFVAACGPMPMLEKVSGMCSEYGVELQVSLENRMACGTGACMGCSLMISGKPQRVCKQGPVFDGREVFT